MRADLEESLTDAVYRAVFEPDAWADTMRLCAQAFPSNGQTFYFLDKPSGRIKPVALEGIAPQWLGAFDALYFTPDNPWIGASEPLHRPGVVRTNERLETLLGDKGVLYRSSYYNDWMRPQGFRFTLGNTLFAEDDVVANITLMRPPNMPTFSTAEVSAFERLSVHMTRALRLAVRMEQQQPHGTGVALLDALPHGVALVDPQLRLVHANPAMERLLRAGRGLRLRHDRLETPDPLAQHELMAAVTHALQPHAVVAHTPRNVRLPLGPHTTLTLQATPARGLASRYLPHSPMALLSTTHVKTDDPLSQSVLRQRYNCTPAETRLALGLMAGLSLRAAAQAADTTYESARTTLKRVFQKLDVHSQSQLVARLQRDLPPA